MCRRLQFSRGHQFLFPGWLAGSDQADPTTDFVKHTGVLFEEKIHFLQIIKG